jgi:hypothetical protein
MLGVLTQRVLEPLAGVEQADTVLGEELHPRLDHPGRRAPASVDSHRSGTMVYEEKYGSGIDTPEVYRRV